MTALLVGILAPFVAAVVALGLGRRLPRLVAPVGVAGAAVAFLTSWAVVGADLASDLGTRTTTLAHVPTGGLAFDLAFRVDGLSALVSLLVASVALAVQIYSVDYLRGDPRYPSYVAFVSLFTAAMLLVVAADDLLVLLVGWEVMGICSYFLIGHHWELREARDSAVKAFLVTRLGDIGFLFGIFALGLGAGSFRISEVQEAAVNGQLTTGTATLATLLLLAGVVGKSAQFPLHVWLPDAMAGPTPVSALIHAATMVAAGVFLVARLLSVFQAAPATLAILAVIAAITMVGSALAALAEEDVKRVLAWSTVSQLAYMLAGLAAGGYTAGVLLLLAHGAFKALLFLCAGAVIHAVGSNLMSAMGGLRRALPVTFVTMTIGLAALAALPPLSGFFAKDAVLGAIQEAALHGGPLPVGAAWVALLAGFGTVALTAAYSTRLWLRVFFGPRTVPVPDEPAHLAPGHPGPGHAGAGHAGAGLAEAPALMRWPLIVLAVPSALLGFVAFAPGAWASWLGGGGPAVASAPELIHVGTTVGSVLLALVSSGLVVWTWRRHDARDPAVLLGRARPFLQQGFRIDDLIAAYVVRPVWVLARAVVAGDRDVVDFYVHGSGRAAHWLGGTLRRVQTGNVQTYLTLLLAGVVLLAVAALGVIA
ncbi:NADH-quinone oxidoreductase subunit L [Actinopolymorpha alba]|uniref:NADH-quinone oxidoreductase subunit 5 family protein n=1 Tax=Actinopolymorpha alba TaxID=533267 RepID=UPI0003699A6C|nr:NADH-quinone oxidoreductase subunit L [Actinopolymorpha alba]